MKELDEIDLLFQSAFEGFETAPDTVVKEHIDRVIASKKKRKRFFLILVPVLFISAAFATMLSFRPLSGNQFTPHESRQLKRAEAKTAFRTIQETPTPDTGSGNKIPGENGRKIAILRHSKSQYPERNTTKSITNTSNSFKKPTTVGGREKAILRPDNSDNKIEAVTDLGDQLSPNTSSSTNNQSEPESEIAAMNKQDSTTLTSNDSLQRLAQLSGAAYEPLPEITKRDIKWSLSILGGWEAEKRKPFESFDTSNFVGKQREFTAIHSSSFYGKLEWNRKLTHRLNLIAGIGFRCTKVTQYTSLYTRDSTIIINGIGSAIPTDSIVYFIKHQTGKQTYQVNAIILPVGLSYLIPLTPKFQLRFSGGLELTYGWLTKKQLQADFSTPGFQSFGCNVWLRPELHYDFGKLRIIGFGSLNQALSQQLKWDFQVRRNPAFGAGVGVSFRL